MIQLLAISAFGADEIIIFGVSSLGNSYTDMVDVCMNFSVVGSTKYTATVLTDLVSGIVVQKRKDFDLQMEECSVSLE
jgi:hypothetical protein